MRQLRARAAFPFLSSSMTQRCQQICFLLAPTIMFLLSVALNYLDSTGLGGTIGLFSNRSGIDMTMRNNYTRSSLGPPPFAFSIWGLIYIYQLAMLAYNWSLVFRKSSSGDWLCTVPGLQSRGFLLAHAATSVCNGTWVFLNDRVTDDINIMVPMAIVLFGIAINIWIAITFSLQHLAANRGLLVQEGLSLDYWLVVGLVQNAAGLYAGWVTIASFLNMDSALINLAHYPIAESAMLCLCQLGILVAAYVTADTFILDKQTRFFFAPYVSLMWALVTSSARHFKPGFPKSDLSVELTVVLGLALVGKIVLSIYRQIRRPLPLAGGDGRSSNAIMDSNSKFARLELS